MREQQREILQQRYECLWIIGLRGHVDSACQQRRSLLFVRGGTQPLGEECLLQLAEVSLKIWRRSLVCLPKARPGALQEIRCESQCTDPRQGGRLDRLGMCPGVFAHDIRDRSWSF